ncbi:MAG: carboxypeptidase regulatory-like domain-containing protein [Ignavibacteriales bacterium]|nr:carboxypeptidase regulatory-like domain-containing protein [Ignavibacteriales bacterium]
MPKKLSVILLFVFLIHFLSCKEDIVEPTFYGGISGIVEDSDTGDPIANVLVITSPTTSSVTTGDDGKFTFTELETGEYSIIAEKDNYIKKTITIVVEKNKIASAAIQLREKSSVETNIIPTKPVIVSPNDNSENMNNTLNLSWYSTDENEDTLYYDVYLISPEKSDKELIIENFTDTTITLENLNYSSTYFWQVVVTDKKSEKVNGDIWSFTTKEFPNNPIIFTSNKSGNFEIYSAEIDTTNQEIIQLTKSNSNEFWPRFNPTRNLIGFVNDKDIENHIYTMSLDGKDIYKVTQVPIAGLHNNGMGFCWSPNGNEIYYSNYNKIYRISKDGTNLTEIAVAPDNRNFREIDVSVSGEKLAVLTIGQNFYDSEIYTMNSNGSEMKLIVDNLDGAVQNPIFTIDGKSLIYTNDVSGHISATNRILDNRIYSISLDSLEVKELSTGKSNGTNDINPKISPNGANIIFENVSNDNANESKIMIMNVDGSNRRSLNVNGRMPDWK